MEIRLPEPASHRLGVLMVAVRQLFGRRPALSSDRSCQSTAPSTEDAGVLRPHRNQNRVPKRVPHLQGGVRHTYPHTLELMLIFRYKLCDRVWVG